MSRVRLLVLDCHGLVLNDPWRQFIRDCAHRAGADEAAWLHRWRHEWRQRAWLGQISDDELWEALCGESRDRADWAGFLEPRYSPGPAAPHLERWRRHAGVVLLSNHRGAWLRPRLERWQLTRCFDRILVSDEIASVKPDRRAFEAAIGEVPADSVLYADNAEANVNAARQAGLEAVLAAPDDRWIAEVDTWLG